MTHEHPIPMLLHQEQHLFPGVGYSTGAPVMDGCGFDIENFCQSRDASSGFDCLVEDLHGADDITKVSETDHFCSSMIETMSTLAQRLKEARLAKGEIWSQKHLAIVAGVSTGTIGMMESGKRGNKESIPGTLPQIAKALGVRYEWLAHGEEPRSLDGLPPAGALASVSTMPEYLHLQVMQLAILLNSIPAEKQNQAYLAATQALIQYLPGAPAISRP